MKSLFTIATLGFIAGIVFLLGTHAAFEATNSLEFCISCHEMERGVYQEYKQSVHYNNASGVQVICADCHVPKTWGAKVVAKIKASADVYYWLVGSIDTPEKFEAKRYQLAQRVWKIMQESDSRECRSCHDFDAMKADDQGLFAGLKHKQAKEKGQSCIDCHKGIAHQLPQPPVPEAQPQVAASGDPAKEGEEKKPFDYDPDYGEEINETCAGCHGEWGEGSLDGEYPRLAGFKPEYLEKQLRLFKKRERLNYPMVPYTNERELPEEDIKTIAIYLSKIDLPTKLPPVKEDEIDSYERLLQSKMMVNIPRYAGSTSAGKWIYHRECATCHGEKAEGKPANKTPPLAGQHSLYLKRQIDQFRRAERLHDQPEDQAVFQQLTDDQVDNLLAYLSVLDD